LPVQAQEGEKQKQLKAAQQALAGAAAARADDPAVWTTTAVCSAALGRPDDALSALHKALKLQPPQEQAEQLAQVVQSCARHLLRKEQHRQLAGCMQAAAEVAAQLPSAGQQQLKERLGAALQGSGDAAEVQEARAAVEKLP
jgi:tetratricopeptide (TPR) repeat protein